MAFEKSCSGQLSRQPGIAAKGMPGHFCVPVCIPNPRSRKDLAAGGGGYWGAVDPPVSEDAAF
nr:hypothetical protein [uncultured Cohaesibacter sp.]